MQPSVFSQRLATYVGADQASPVKHVFTMLAGIIAERGEPIHHALDIGCASGDLLVFLARQFPAAKLTGVDLSEPLIDMARQRVELQTAKLLCGDGIAYRGDRADVVTCFGMLGIFDQFEPVLEALLANRSPGGIVVLHALLNPDDIDVMVTYRDNSYSPDWQRGFNIFSRRRITDWLFARDLTATFYDIELPIDLPKRPHQPHRAHTTMMADGSRRTINGLCQILPEALLVIADRATPKSTSAGALVRE